MVGKLIKHELYAMFRVLLFTGVAVLVFSCLGAFLNATSSAAALSGLFMLAALYLALFLLVYSILLSVVRFSKSLFSGEGYMTFSLPVTPSQLLISKLVSALIASFYGVLVSVLSIIILFFGLGADVIALLEQAFGTMWNGLVVFFESDPLVVIEIILLILVAIPMSLLLWYTFIAIGQMFTKGRVWITILMVFGFNWIAMPILLTFCIVPILELAGQVSYHLSLWLSILGAAGVDVGCFFLVRYIMIHKVNLLV